MRSWTMIVAVGLFLAIAAPIHATTLTLWEHDSKEMGAFLDEAITRFRRDNPGVAVVREHFDKDDLVSELELAHLHKKAPDVILSSADIAGVLEVLHLIQPVSWLPTGMFYPPLVAGITHDKKLWGVPVAGGQHLLMFGNKKLVPALPSTLEELTAAARKLTDARKHLYGLAFPTEDPLWFSSFLAAFGASPLVGNQAGLPKKAVADALQYVGDLILKYQVAPARCDYVCAENKFMNSQAAMLINGDWARSRYEDQLKDNLLVAPLPQLRATGRPMASLTAGRYLLVYAGVRHEKLELAKKFAAMLTSIQVQREFIEKMRQPPARQGLEDTPAIAESPAFKASVAAMAQGEPLPMQPELKPVWAVMGKALGRFQEGSRDAKATAQAMHADAKAALRQKL